MPSEPGSQIPEVALVRVENELRRRELRLQAELISLRPLVQSVSTKLMVCVVFNAIPDSLPQSLNLFDLFRLRILGAFYAVVNCCLVGIIV